MQKIRFEKINKEQVSIEEYIERVYLIIYESVEMEEKVVKFKKPKWWTSQNDTEYKRCQTIHRKFNTDNQNFLARLLADEKKFVNMISDFYLKKRKNNSTVNNEFDEIEKVMKTVRENLPGFRNRIEIIQTNLINLYNTTKPLLN